ncbi:cytochrome b/b6 domain-containing protein [Reyranella sp.]|uniref:cytochrome b/b6 domain-containing protein n=1 Tax=Reyranella sp. TaxID=1929291 RepID=UPI003BACBA5B
MAERTVDKVRIWDLPVRLFHWALVILLATSYFSGQAGGDWMNLHFWSGYAILTLLIFRIAWGFIGSTTARFSGFVRGPVAAIAYLRALARGERTYDIGHNPAGGLMVVVMIVAVLMQVVAGLFAADTDTGMVNGPLANLIADKWVDRLTEFHEFWVNILLLLIAVHVLAAIVYLVWKRHNLIRAMVTGAKPVELVAPPGAPAPVLAFASGWLALAVLVVSAAIVYLVVRLG